MNGDYLHKVLDRATDAVEPQGLANRAMATARQRQQRRRGLAAGAVSVVAVVAVVVGVQGVTGSPTTDATPPVPAASDSTSPRLDDEPGAAPAIPPSRIQSPWDPRGVDRLPVLDLGLPRELAMETSGVVTAAAALLDGPAETLLVGGDGTQSTLVLPDGLGSQRTVRLSPDGERVAAVGLSGFFWRDLDADEWRKVEVPTSVTGEGIEVTWLPGSESLVLRSHLPGVEIDLATGDQRTLPQLNNYVGWGADPEGNLTYLPNDQSLRQLVSEQPDGSLRTTYVASLEGLQRPSVSDTSIVAARANISTGSEPGSSDSDGLIALDRDTLATRAFLPVPDENSYYVDGGTLTAQSWLDDDTVLFTVLPKDAPTEHLVAWNVETGDLSQITRWPTAYTASFGTDLLTRR